MSDFCDFSDFCPISVRGWLIAAVVFSLSLILRSIDQAVCDALPIGSHFAWHLLNAYVLYRVSVALVSGVTHNLVRP